jgi:outer membrane protein W
VKRLHPLVVVLLICIAGPAAAGKMSYGAKVGMTLFNITQTPAEWEQEQLFKAGFTGGVFMNYALNENFSIQPELLYTQKGVKGSLDLWEEIIVVDLKASFDYIELPLLAKYTFVPEKKFRPFVYGGPAFAYTLGSELTLSAFGFSADVDFSDLTHVTDFLFIAGAGFDYPLGRGALLFDVRFQYGFTNVILSGDFEVDGSTQTIDEDDFKNYGFAFMVGYGF